MHKLLSVSINWNSEMPRVRAVDEILTRPNDDWIRFSGAQWYVWTDRQIRELAEVLRELVIPSGQCVIASLEPVAANGTAPEWLWTWMNDRMKQKITEQFESGQRVLPHIN